MNSRAKGCNGERECAKWLTSIGFPAERGARNGVKSGQDIICESLPRLHIEVKRSEAIDIGTTALADAYAQACTDAKGGKIPVVMWRKNGGKCWRVTFTCDRNGYGLVTAAADKWLLECLNSGVVKP